MAIGKAQFVEVPLPWDSDLLGVYCCPICGATVNDVEHCPHVVFVYMDDACEFSTPDESVAELLDPLVEDLGDEGNGHDDEVHPARQACDLLERPSAVCLYFAPTATSSGMAFCFDFAIPPDEGADEDADDGN